MQIVHKCLVLVFAGVTTALAWAADDAFFSYQVDESCNVANVTAIADATLPSNFLELLAFEKSYGFKIRDGVRRQIKIIELTLYRSDTEPRVLTCHVDYAGNVLFATLVKKGSRVNRRKRNEIPGRLVLHNNRLPELGTFTRSF